MQYLGIDINKSICELAHKQGFECICAKVPPLPSTLAPQSFDLIFLSHVLEHFINFQEALKVLEELRELLKPSGFLVLFHPDYLSYGTDYFFDYSHSLILTRNRVNNMVLDSDYKILHSKDFYAYFSFPIFPRIIDLFANFIGATLLALTGNRKFHKLKLSFHRNLLTICKRA